jgi:hypothetical protein
MHPQDVRDDLTEKGWWSNLYAKARGVQAMRKVNEGDLGQGNSSGAPVRQIDPADAFDVPDKAPGQR